MLIVVTHLKVDVIVKQEVYLDVPEYKDIALDFSMIRESNYESLKGTLVRLLAKHPPENRPYVSFHPVRNETFAMLAFPNFKAEKTNKTLSIGVESKIKPTQEIKQS